MCGIVGKLYFDPDRYVDKDDIRQMTNTLAHRGPDGEGAWVDANVGLGHRRLSIIDLRTVASQPMCNEDGSVWITFNGEIYNFRELREELEAKGHCFRTNSDTEAIVHAYEEYGRSCVDRLRGMFAFAIWDMRQKTLFVARDRVGKKPLFYYVDHERLIFASEIKAILTDQEVRVEADPVAIDHFLALQYIPTGQTAFRGIQKLPAAHWLEVRDTRIEIGRYWKLHYEPKRHISWQDAVEELRWHIAEAVRIRLISDVPLGAFLSGGIDSSAVVAHMARAMDSPVRTFSVGFEEEKYDERHFARMLAEQYRTDHTELVVRPSVVDILQKLVWHYDEPFGDASAVPSYAIAQLTRRHATVVLTGDGGDESFAGYDRYIVNHQARHGEILPRGIWRGIDALFRRVPSSYLWKQPWKKLRSIAQAMAQTPERRYARWICDFLPESRNDLYTDSFRDAVQGSDPEQLFVGAFERSDAKDWTDAMLDMDVDLYLADDLLVKMDRATMAHSLEARAPLLDHVLMEFAATLPSDFKLSKGKTKRILKASLRGLMPDAILDRPKMGFAVPMDDWFRTELREITQDLLLSPRATQRGYFRPERVESLLKEHLSGQANRGSYLWDLLVLEMWHRTFIDNHTGTPEIQLPAT